MENRVSYKIFCCGGEGGEKPFWNGKRRSGVSGRIPPLKNLTLTLTTVPEIELVSFGSLADYYKFFVQPSAITPCCKYNYELIFF